MQTPSIQIYSEEESQVEAECRTRDDVPMRDATPIADQSPMESALRVEDGSQWEDDSPLEDESEPELLPTDLSAGELLTQLEKRQSQLLDDLDSLDQRIVGLLKEVLGERYQEIA